jgi:predicted nucleic acid-binding protein
MGPVALDSCVIIYAMERHPEFGDTARRLLERLDDPDDSMRAVASALALIEVLVQPLRLGRHDLVSEYRNRLTDTGGGLTLVPVTPEVAERAALLRAGSPSLTTPDAIHAATAIVSGADVFLTNDPAFKGLPGLRVVMLPDWK